MATLTIEYRNKMDKNQTVNTHTETFESFEEMDEFISDFFITNLLTDAFTGSKNIDLGFSEAVLRWLESEAVEPLHYDYGTDTRSTTLTFTA